MVDRVRVAYPLASCRARIAAGAGGMVTPLALLKSRMMKIRVGVVGLGDAWEHRHRAALRALGDRFEVRAVCEQVGHLAAVAASEFGAAPSDGFRAIIRREDVDAVLILAPQWYGALPVLAACDAGKAVYCAPGLHVAGAEVDAVKQRVEQSGVAFMAEFPRRHAPATIRLKELICTHLGTPRLLFCHQRLPAANGCTHPTARPQRSSQQELIELVDWCRYVVGHEPSAVMSVYHQAKQPGVEEDYQMMSLDFSEPGHPGTGPTAQISCGRYIPGEWQEAISYRPLAGLQVSCERGIAFVDLPGTIVWFDEAGRHVDTVESERPMGETLLTHFYRSVTSLVRKPSDLEDAYRALAIVRQARQAYEKRVWMPIE